ncbi:hypothetical protein [Brevibacillus brevis]|uniref:hypothetical protein n=1 Tax=Brevibacillus TaxID=55080 RepID=UPI0016436E4C|nr:hypothetical protein [Brevibacillus brevis]
MKIIFQENGKYAIDYKQLTRSTGAFYKTHELLNGEVLNTLELAKETIREFVQKQ